MKSPIELYLLEKINKDGNLPFSDFMEIALFHPKYGYYMSGPEILGKQGDFITSPVTSSLFGESISNEFSNLDDDESSIIELGGGDGSLAISLLESLKAKKNLPKEYIIIETSQNLINLQKKNIKQRIPDLLNIVRWANDTNNLKINGLIIANEFFDVLPSDRFKFQNNEVNRLYITNKNNNFSYEWKEGSSAFNSELESSKNNQNIVFPDGYVSELNLNYRSWITDLDKCLTSGVILLIDYGYNSREYFLEERNSGTLVCINNHNANFAPLNDIGKQDISTFVNFSHLQNIFSNINLEACGYLAQSSFLLNLGILDIFEKKNYAPNEKLIELNRLKNILLPNTMGEIFKVLVVSKNLNKELLATTNFNYISKL